MTLPVHNTGNTEKLDVTKIEIGVEIVGMLHAFFLAISGQSWCQKSCLGHAVRHDANNIEVLLLVVTFG